MRLRVRVYVAKGHASSQCTKTSRISTSQVQANHQDTEGADLLVLNFLCHNMRKTINRFQTSLSNPEENTTRLNFVNHDIKITLFLFEMIPDINSRQQRNFFNKVKDHHAMKNFENPLTWTGPFSENSHKLLMVRTTEVHHSHHAINGLVERQFFNVCSRPSLALVSLYVSPSTPRFPSDSNNSLKAVRTRTRRKRCRHSFAHSTRGRPDAALVNVTSASPD